MKTSRSDVLTVRYMDWKTCAVLLQTPATLPLTNIGLMLDRNSYCATAEELLFNKKLPSVLDYSKSSFVVDENTSDGEMMMTAMGQGNTLVSPYHMALITQAIANGGTLMEPYLVDKVTNYKGTEIRKNVPKSYKNLMTSEEASQLKDYMRAVVDEGTATMLSGQSYSVAGKIRNCRIQHDRWGKNHIPGS